MNEKRYYSGIDGMRFAAAILVITIHTSPLGSITVVGDFILTRIVARVAVPFFFMTTGFFTLSRYHRDNRRLKGFLKKTGIIYAAAVLMYLPLNIYQGYFNRPNLLLNLLRDLVFDGTVYHLWYLPAAMLGMLIAWRLVERFDYPKGLAVAAALYMVGLFGDSYYGIAGRLPEVKELYDLLFQLFDYTRNGIFFAPIFLMLGGYMAEQKPRLTKWWNWAGFASSFAMMFTEAMLLHRYGIPRHDSMYLMLPICMVFLFRGLVQFRGREGNGLRTVSLLIYLIHPMMIVVVRAVAKIVHLEALMVQNSLIHFATVCALSFLFGFAVAALWQRFTVKQKHITVKERAYIELDLASLAHNAAILQAAMPQGCELMAVVKANAYGHGDYEISTHLEKNGVKAFAVATIEEGIRLRRYGIRGMILILGYTDIHRAKELRRYRLTQTLIDLDYAEGLNRQGVPVRVHIGIDSGMHRLGFDCGNLTGVRRVFTMKNLRVDGIFTHLGCSDSTEPGDMAFTEEQISRFYQMIDRLKESGIAIPKLHIQSSYGLLNYPELRCDYVRVGIALYGVGSVSEEHTALQTDLRPVLALKARVALIRDVPKGEYIGYGRAFQTKRDSRIAILPIGYADGLPRSLSDGRAYVRIRDFTAPIIGRICMDQLAVDITDAPGVVVGDIATLIENRKDSRISAPRIAEQTGSISNELLSRMGSRLPIVIKE